MALTLHVEIDAETGEFKGAVKGAEDSLKKLSRTGEEAARTLSQSLDRAGARLRSIGARMSLAITAPLTLFARSAKNAAVDAEELQSAFNFSFGKMAAAMNQWAVVTGDALGRSTQALQQQAFTFNQLFKAAAPTADQAADLSRQYTLLANDLSSFFNVAESDALDKLRAGLVGEAEPLRAFGVFLDEAQTQAKALQLGLAATTEELTAQDKILARAALILEQTRDAQGDLARTADSTANQERRLTAEFQEQSVEIGQILQPAYRALIREIGGILGAIRELDPAQKKLFVGLAAAVAAGGPILVGFGLVAGAIGALATPIGVITLQILGPVGLVAAWAIFHERILDSLAQVRILAGVIRELRRDLVAEALATRPDFLVPRAGVNINLAGVRAQPAPHAGLTPILPPPPPPPGGGPLGALRESTRTLGGMLSPPAQRLRLEGRAAELAAIRQGALNDERARAAAIIEAVRMPQERFNEALTDYGELLGKGLLTTDQYKRAVAAAKEELETTSEEQERLNDAAERFGFTFASAFEDAVISGNDLRSVFQGLLDDIQRMILRLLVIEPLANSISDALKGSSSGGGGLFGTLISAGLSLLGGGGQGINTLGGPGGSVAFFGGPRQFGGPVEAGRLFETHGLNSREFFIPSMNGQIATAGQLAGGGTNFFIDATGADRAAFEQLKADLTAMLMAMAGPGRVEERAVSAVVQTRRRDPRLFQGAL